MSNQQTNFSTQTPQATSTQPTQPTPNPPQHPPKTPISNYKKILLLIEDDPLLINMYQTKFTNEGLQVFTATDGEAGLILAQNEKPNIIILDIMMPKLDGIEVLRKIRQNPKLKHIPIIILSNLSEPAKQKEAIQLGAKEFLIKANLTPTQVVEKIHKHLNVRK